MNIEANLEVLGKISDSKLYLGIDLTAPSLHLGHLNLFWQVISRAPSPDLYIVLGTFTSAIGDPTGKTKARMILTKRTLGFNFRKICLQIIKLLPSCKILINSLWLEKLKLRDYLVLLRSFSINNLLKIDIFRQRIQSGNHLSLSECCYPSLQAYDHFYLAKNKNILGQVAGIDQKSNIISSLKLCKENHLECFGLLYPLLTDKGGEKFGKSSTNIRKTPWFDSNMCDHFLFFHLLSQTSLIQDSEFINWIFQARGYLGDPMTLVDSGSRESDLPNILVDFFNVKNLSAAKFLISEGVVYVNDQGVTRKGLILNTGDTITMSNKKIKIK